MVDYLPQLSEPARRWVRFGLLLACLALLCWVAYFLRGVFTPLLIALALAYTLNPLVTWLERRRRVDRLYTVSVLSAVLGVGLLVLMLVGGARLIVQIEQLIQNVPAYVETVGEWVRRTQTQVATTAPATSQSESWWAYAAPVLKAHGVTLARTALDWILSLMSSVAAWVSLLVLVPLYTFYFLWRFNDMVEVVRVHLPAAVRPRVVHLARVVDSAMANFFRGRLLVCLIIAAFSAIGWSLVGIPYSLLLGLAAGALNLVPFMSLLALPPALLSAYLGAAQAGEPWVWPVVLAMAVYVLGQALESFVLSPLIEGRSSGLHPLAIVIVILIGGELAGLLGMLLAIPVASTLRAVAAESILPEIRRLAVENVEPPPAP